jgi:outer membrane lipoprotein
MKTKSQLFLFLLLSILLSGCAQTISPKLMAKVDSSLTFKKVLQNPDAYKGKTVLWGGQIIQILPQDVTTLVEVLQMPLGRKGKPEESYASEGKFLILFKKLLDFSQFDKGRKITVAGEIQGTAQGEEIKSLGEKDYLYPVVSSEEIHLWYFHPYSSLAPLSGPWWYESPERGLRF